MERKIMWSGWIVAMLTGICLIVVLVHRPVEQPAGALARSIAAGPTTQRSSATTRFIIPTQAELQKHRADIIREVTANNPFTLGKYPPVSPFEAVRWRGDVPEVMVNETWYELLAMNDLSAGQIVDLCKSMDKREWAKRFTEDLVAVLTVSGHKPGATATLRVKDLATGMEQTLNDVPLTEENRKSGRNFRAEEIVKSQGGLDRDMNPVPVTP